MRAPHVNVKRQAIVDKDVSGIYGSNVYIYRCNYQSLTELAAWLQQRIDWCDWILDNNKKAVENRLDTLIDSCCTSCQTELALLDGDTGINYCLADWNRVIEIRLLRFALEVT